MIIDSHQKLKEKIWSIYNSGSVIPLPLIPATDAAPLALLDIMPNRKRGIFIVKEYFKIKNRCYESGRRTCVEIVDKRRIGYK